MKKGFTLAEALITLAVIGSITALTLPVLMQSTGQNTKILFKASYKNIEAVVNELINDVSLYPAGEFIDNTFCSNFFDKTNIVGSTAATCANTFVSVLPVTEGSAGTYNAITTNAMVWYGLEDDFGSATCPDAAPGSCIKIQVDVDGYGKGKNTTVGTAKDILDIYLFKSGKLTVASGSTEATHLTE